MFRRPVWLSRHQNAFPCPPRVVASTFGLFVAVLFAVACSSPPSPTPTTPAAPTVAAAPAVTATTPPGAAITPTRLASPSPSPAAASPTVGASPSPAPVASPARPSPSPSPVAGAPSGQLEVVKVAHAPSLLFAPLYLAIEKGYFREQGVDAQLETVTAGQDAAALTAAGQLDATVAGFAVATFNGIQRGLDLRIVASMAKQPTQGIPSPLMVRKDLIEGGQVKTVADLKGRKVGIAGGNGSTGSYYLAVKLREAGLALGDVEIVNLPFADQVTALRQKAIDAAYPPAPFSGQVLNEGIGDIFGGPTAPGRSGTGVLLGGGFAKNRPNAAVGLMAGLIKGARDLQNRGYYEQPHLEIFAKYTRLPVDVLRNLDTYTWDADLRPDTATLLDMQTVFIQNGLLRYNPPLTADKLIDEQIIAQALARLR